MTEKLLFLEKIKSTLNVTRARLAHALKKENIQKLLQNFDTQVVIEWATQLFQKQSANFYGTLVTVLLSTYFLSDLTALTVGEFIPEPPLSRSNRFHSGMERAKTINDYSVIFSRNLFSSQNLIPGDDAPASGRLGDPGGVAVKSSLPFNLIGTLIMENKMLSIATIEDKSTSIIHPMQVNDEIPEKIKVLEIDVRRVTFVNKALNRREFIELPEDLLGQGPRLVTSAKPGGTGIEKVSSTQYSIARSEVDRALSDINSILTQARAVPNFENGTPNGYKLFQIVPGSIYDKLGLQNGDVITGLNGQTINDPGKAFEMFSELKTSNHLELQVKKEGKPASTYTYDIH